MSIKKIILVILFSLICSFINAEENLKKVGKFKDWESFIVSQDGAKICFAQSIPVSKSSKKIKERSFETICEF